MEFTDYFPVWTRLTPEQQKLLSGAVMRKHFPQGMSVHRGSLDCTGLLLVKSGQLRAYILSDEGREITLYSLFERVMCLFSAACMLRDIQFEITVEAERDTEVWIIPPDTYKTLMEASAAVANYTNDMMSSRFSEVMWLMEQIMWRSFDKRLADFLLQESVLEGAAVLNITHERIANHLGTAREVVTRMLRYFQGEGMVKLSRGSVELTDRKRLEALCAK